jgi:hypothetical protein
MLVADDLVVRVDTHKDVHVAVVAGWPGWERWPMPAWREPGVTDTGWRACWPDVALKSGSSTARTAPGGADVARATRSMLRTPPARYRPAGRLRSPRTARDSSGSCSCCC